MQVEQLEERWCPSYTLVTSRTALASTDSVNWGTLVPTPPPSAISVANPFTILSTAGRSISVSEKLASAFVVTQQIGPPPAYQGPGNWNGNFAVGDWVLDTDSHGNRTNPITLNFGATAVAAGGAQIQPNLGNIFTFTAKVEAFDANGNSLASFTEAGTATNAADNSAIFIGISSSSANISQIALSLTKVSGQGADKSWFAINQFDFRTSVVAAAPAISQPASAIDLAPLASSLLSTGQPAMPAAPRSAFGAPSAPPARQSGVLPTSDTTSAVHVGATDAVFAVSHAAASDDNAWLLAPLSFSSLDAM